MKQFRKRFLVFGFLLVLFAILPVIVNAQPPDDDPGDPDAPIDGGVSLLVAAGIGYGLKKARDNRKKITTNL